MSPDAWTAKEITQLLLQCGALGLCFLMLMMGVYMLVTFGNKFLEELRALRAATVDLHLLITDHKARAGDTPPKMRELRG